MRSASRHAAVVLALAALGLGSALAALAVPGLGSALLARAASGPGAAAAQTRPGATVPSAGRPHGDPRGWAFKLPAGDAARGRAVFQKFECYRCHAMTGETFAPPNARDAGPELTAMGRHHSAAFLAESIVNPGAFVDRAAGGAAADGSSKMPSFNDAMTVQELLDLVAYLQRPRPAPPAPAGHRH